MVLIDNFEGSDTWWTFNGATKSFVSSNPTPQEGTYCMKCNYPAYPSGWVGWGKDLNQNWSIKNALLLYFYGDGSNNVCHIDFKDADNETWTAEFKITWSGWRAIRILISDFKRTAGSGDNVPTLSNVQYMQIAIYQPAAASWIALDYIRADVYNQPVTIIDDFEGGVPIYTHEGVVLPTFEAHITNFEGSYSGKFSFSVSASASYVWKSMGNKDWTNYDYVGLYLLGNGSSNWFIMLFVDNDDEQWQVFMQLNFTYWKKFIFSFGDFSFNTGGGNQSGNKIFGRNNIKQMLLLVPSSTISGYFYVDSIEIGKMKTSTGIIDIPWKMDKPKIIGWYPDWNDTDMPRIALERTRKIITHLSPVWYRLKNDGSGNLITTQDLVNAGKFGSGVIPEKNKTIEFCRRQGIPIVPLVSSYDAINESSWELAEPILDDTNKINTLVDNIYNECVNNKWSGVNIDFEGMDSGYRDKMNLFLKKLYEKLNPAGFMVSIDLPSKTTDAGSAWNAWADYATISQYVDYCIVMCYDQNGPWAPTIPGSVAALWWFEGNIEYAITRIPRRKLIIGIGTYGYNFNITDGTCDYSTWQETNALMIQYNKTPTYPAPDYTPRFQYITGVGKLHEVHYEDSVSLQYKISLVKKYNVAGIAFWRLDIAQGEGYPGNSGYDDTMAYWDETKKISTGSGSKLWL